VNLQDMTAIENHWNKIYNQSKEKLVIVVEELLKNKKRLVYSAIQLKI